MVQDKGPSIMWYSESWALPPALDLIIPQIRPQFKMADLALIGLYFLCARAKSSEILCNSMGDVRGFGEATTV
jgi:hypothetical protein